MLRALQLFLLLLTSNIYAQQALEEIAEQFGSPLEIPLILSGTFGELRSRHFHAGIDIKTRGAEGFKVLATADGVVSRVKVSAYGYGNALYIKHPNGYTSVYAHLQKFNKVIDDLVFKEQMNNKSFEVDFNVEAHNIAFKKGEKIGLSGNSGGSGAPHLHFEIRETKSEQPINPLKAKYPVNDSQSPLVNGPLLIYKVESPHQYQTKSKVLKLVPNGPNAYVSEKKVQELDADKIGIGVRCFDLLNGAKNWNGVYQLTVKDNGTPVFGFTMDRLDFAEGGYINTFVDYDWQNFKGKTYIKCFKEKNNNWGFYDHLGNDNGFIDLSDGQVHNVVIEIRDLAGNQSNVNVTLQKGKSGIVWEEDQSFQQLLYADLPNHSNCGDLHLSFNHKNLFADLPFSCDAQDSTFVIGNPRIPVYRPYEICIDDLAIDPENKSKYLLLMQSKENENAYALSGSKWSGTQLCAKSKKFGKVSLGIDTIPPTIKPRKNYKKLKVAVNKQFVFEIKDELSGLQSFDAYIDDKWVVLNHDAKRDYFWIDLTKYQLSKGLHELQLVVKDERANLKYYALNFNYE